MIEGPSFDGLEDAVMATVKRLREVAKILEKDVGKALDEFDEMIYATRRVQLHRGAWWETLYYEFLLAWGGPTILVRTDGTLEAFGAKEYIRASLKDEEDVMRLLEEMHRLLEDVKG